MSAVKRSVVVGRSLVVRCARSGRKAVLFVLRATSLQRAVTHRHRPIRI
jgi:hypothetical protein